MEADRVLLHNMPELVFSSSFRHITTYVQTISALFQRRTPDLIPFFFYFRIWHGNEWRVWRLLNIWTSFAFPIRFFKLFFFQNGAWPKGPTVAEWRKNMHQNLLIFCLTSIRITAQITNWLCMYKTRIKTQFEKIVECNPTTYLSWKFLIIFSTQFLV